MKSRLRFVLILGILGLLTSLVAIGPAFADTGKVALKGGALDTLGVARGKFFSDKQGFNIVTATTADDDLSPVRTGVAIFDFDGVDALTLRGLPGGGSGAFDLKGTAVIKPIFNSEKDEAKKFSGNTSLASGTADNLGTVTSGTAETATADAVASATVLRDVQGTFVTAGVAAGDLVTNTTDAATCTVGTVNSETQLTCAAALTVGALFDATDAYTVTDTQAASTTILKDRQADFKTAGVAVGDIITNSTDSATCRVGAVTSPIQLTCAAILDPAASFDAPDAYTVGDASFDLGDITDPKNRGRNRNADVNLNIDDVLAKVSGTEVVVDSVTIHANGYITGDVILTNAPSTGTDNVVITIGISEYDQGAPEGTPISSASFAFGTTAFDNTPNLQGANSINNELGVITTTRIGATNFVKLTFNYNVKETQTDLMTFTTPTLGSRGLTRKLDGVETTVSSNKFEAIVALFSGSDFDKIKTVIDAGDRTMTIDDIQAVGTINDALETRISAAVTALTAAVIATEADVGSAVVFLAHILPVVDGDVLTVTYVDTSPAGTRTAVADIDLKAPTLVLVGPTQKSYMNSLSQTLVMEVEDEASVGGKRSGMATADLEELWVTTAVGGPTGKPANAVVPLFLGGEKFRVSLSKQFGNSDEGEVSWYITTQDKVGNIPASTVEGSDVAKPFKFNLDVTPAVPSATGAIRPVVTGGKVDTRFAVPLTGSVTVAGTPTTQLDDANAKFMTNGVKVNDKITNTTDSSTALVLSIVSETRITHVALSGTPGNTWTVGEGYKIENPLVDTITSSGTAVGAVSIFYDLGVGKSPIDDATASAADFTVGGANPSSIIVGAVNKTANEQGILLILAGDLSTTDKPLIEQTGAMKDRAGNTIATFTGTANDIAAKDGLSPVMTLTVTGTAASRPVTNNKVTISIVANEDTSTPTVSVYTVGHTTNTGNAVGSTVAVGTLKFVTTRSWEVDVTPGAGLYSVFAEATDTGGNTGKAGVEGVTGSDTDIIDGGIQIDLTKATLFEKDTGIPAPTLLPASTSNASPFISANFAGEGKEYGLEKCTGTAGNETPAGCDAADVTAERGVLSTDSAKVTTSYDLHKTVTLMSASIDGTDVTAEINTVDNITFLYKATDLSIADHTFIIRVMDASGNEREFSKTVKVTERALFKVNLIPGWNMISFPGTPADSSVAAVIGSTPVTTIYTFAPTTASKWMVAVRERMEDGTFGPFVGNLTNIDPNQAYWVLTDTFEAIQVDIPPLQGGAVIGSTPSTPPTIEVVEGWNFIPVLDVTGALSAGATLDSAVYFAGSIAKIARIYVFDTQAGTWTLIIAGAAVDDLVVGKAYWVFATSAFTLVP